MALLKNILLFAMLAFLGWFALYTRLELLYFVSGDYDTYVSQWLNHLKQNGPFHSFAQQFSNYSPAYLHLLSVNLWLKINDLYFVKYLSILFEISTAVAIYKIALHVLRKEPAAVAAAMLFLSLPTVIMNGAQWAQCDVIYASFIAWFFYFIITERPFIATLALGIAFAFKLQAVFVFPFYLLLLLKGKIKWRHLPFLFIPFLCSLIPSYLAGRDGIELLRVYLDQDGSTDKNFSINFPGIYTLFNLPVEHFEMIRNGAILMTGIVVVALIFALLKRTKKSSSDQLITTFLLFALLVPFLLPRMHERYYFVAEVVALVYAIYYPKRWWLPLLLQLSAINTYYQYFYGEYLFPVEISTVLIIAAVFFPLKQLFIDSRKEPGIIS